MSERNTQPKHVCFRRLIIGWIVIEIVCVHSWTEVIKAAVDDLKKSGAPMRLTLPPEGGGAPLSPSVYVLACATVCVCLLARYIHCLPKFTHLQIPNFFRHFLSIRLNAPLSPTENGSLKNSSGEIAVFYQLNTQ